MIAQRMVTIPLHNNLTPEQSAFIQAIQRDYNAVSRHVEQNLRPVLEKHIGHSVGPAQITFTDGIWTGLEFPDLLK